MIVFASLQRSSIFDFKMIKIFEENYIMNCITNFFILKLKPKLKNGKKLCIFFLSMLYSFCAVGR